MGAVSKNVVRVAISPRSHCNSSSVSRADFFPLMIPETSSAQAGLEITPWDASVVVNSTVSFRCQVINGHNNAEPIEWHPVPMGAFVENDTLVFLHVQPEHEGFYDCFSGNMTNYATLHVGKWQVLFIYLLFRALILQICACHFRLGVRVCACVYVCVSVCLSVSPCLCARMQSPIKTRPSWGYFCRLWS